MSKADVVAAYRWPALLSVTRNAPGYLDLSEPRVAALIRDGHLTAVNIGRRRYVTRADCDLFIERLREGVIDGAALGITADERRVMGAVIE